MKNLKIIPSLFIILMITFSISQAFSQEKYEITHGPYLIDPADDGMTVVWFTSENSVSWVEYTEYQSSASFPTWGGNPKIAKSSKIGLIDANTKKHIIRINNLDPGKTYKYRVNSKAILQFDPYEVVYGETIVGEFHTFSTLDPRKESFTFSVIADVHEKEQVIYDLDKQNALESYDMVFLNGDILSWIGEEKRIFGGFLDAAVETFAKTKPFIYVRGNHETRGPGSRTVMSYFPHRSGQNYHAFTHGDVRFVVLDCGEDKPDDHPVYAGLADFDSYRSEQAEWLRKEVQREAFRNASYRIIITHMPMEKDGWHGPMDLYKKWRPILNNARIDLVINGHKHRYERIDKGGDFNFPTLIIDKNMLLDANVSDNNIDITVIDIDGKKVDELSIPKL